MLLSLDQSLRSPTSDRDARERFLSKHQQLPRRLDRRLPVTSQQYLWGVPPFSEIEWDGDVLDGKHGYVGMQFLAEVCRYGAATVQQALLDEIKVNRAAAGHAQHPAVLVAVGGTTKPKIPNMTASHAWREQMLKGTSKKTSGVKQPVNEQRILR